MARKHQLSEPRIIRIRATFELDSLEPLPVPPYHGIWAPTATDGYIDFEFSARDWRKANTSFFCSACRGMWAHVTSPDAPTKEGDVFRRYCYQHGNGSLQGTHHREYILPSILLRREFLIAHEAQDTYPWKAEGGLLGTGKLREV